ncbi:MAG: hypothetical protein J6L90_01390 [Clostridia bacterium]|nr:hypothetical protein [Clostridia bacterium]
MEFQTNKVTNAYLSKKEEWDETEVFNYKKKIKVQLAAPWFTMIVMLGIYAAVTMAVWAANIVLGIFGLGDVFKYVSSQLVTVVLLAAFILISFFAARAHAKKKTQKFVIENRGEVGHSGRPYSKGISRGLFFSIIISAAGIAGVLFFNLIYVLDGMENFITQFISMDLLGTLACVIGALLYPLFYHLKAQAVLRSFDKDTCPICSRSNYRMVKRAVNKAEDEVISKQVAYTPGKIAYVYGQFIIDKTKYTRETDESCYITYCRYCSFYVKGNGTEQID